MDLIGIIGGLIIMTDKIFMEGVDLIEVVTQKHFSKDQIRVYRMLLNDLQNNEFIGGINIMLRDRVYTNIPSPAEIIKYTRGTRDNDLEVKTVEAKNKLKQAISSIGTYKSVAFDDPVIHLVIQSVGGWQKLGKMDFKEYTDWLKWEFPKIYKAYATRKNGEIPLEFQGRGEDTGITYVGDRARCLEWQGAYKHMLEQKYNKALEDKGVLEACRVQV